MNDKCDKCNIFEMPDAGEIERMIDALKHPTPEKLLDPEIWYWYLLRRKIERWT